MPPFRADAKTANASGIAATGDKMVKLTGGGLAVHVLNSTIS
jgi:hypothetical protein